MSNGTPVRLVINRKAALERLEGDEELFNEVLELFVATYDESFARVAAALAERNRERLYREAHYLKSASSNVGAERATELLVSIEKGAKTLDFLDLGGMVERLQNELSAVKEEAVRPVGSV